MCDGVTDDTAAFNAASTAAHNADLIHAGIRTIYTPPGVCVVAGQVNVYSDQYWIGLGTILVPTQTGHVFLAVNTDNVTLDTIVINITNAGPGNPNGAALEWHSVADTVLPNNHENFNVINSRVNNAGFGILVYYNDGTGNLSNVNIQGNTISSNAGAYANSDGIHIAGRVNQYTVTGNHVNNRADAGIALTSEVIGAATYICSGGSITDNVLLEDRVGLDNSGAQYTLWAGNYVKSTIAAPATSNVAYRQISYPATSTGVFPIGIHAIGNYLNSADNSGAEFVAKIDVILPGIVWPNVQSSFEKNVIDGPNSPFYLRGTGISFGDNTLINGGFVKFDYDGVTPQSTSNIIVGPNKWLAAGSLNWGGGCFYNNFALQPQYSFTPVATANFNCIQPQKYVIPDQLETQTITSLPAQFLSIIPGAGATQSLVVFDPALANVFTIDNAGNGSFGIGNLGVAGLLSTGGIINSAAGFSIGGVPGITHTTTHPCTGTQVFTHGLLTSTTGTC